MNRLAQPISEQVWCLPEPPCLPEPLEAWLTGGAGRTGAGDASGSIEEAAAAAALALVFRCLERGLEEDEEVEDEREEREVCEEEA